MTSSNNLGAFCIIVFFMIIETLVMSTYLDDDLMKTGLPNSTITDHNNYGKPNSNLLNNTSYLVTNEENVSFWGKLQFLFGFSIPSTVDMPSEFAIFFSVLNWVLLIILSVIIYKWASPFSG